MLSFSLLFPIFLLTVIVHEAGHALVALALGFRVLSIELYQEAAYIHAPFQTEPSALSYGVFVLGGYLAQYALGIVALFALTRLRPRSFLVGSLVSWIVMQNLIAPALSLGSLQGDSGSFARTVVNASGIEAIPTLVQISAMFLVLAGSFVCVRMIEAFLRTTFRWLERPRSAVTATLTVTAYIAISVIYFLAGFTYPQYFVAIVIGASALSLTIPSAPPFSEESRGLASRELVIAAIFFGSVFALLQFATPILILF